MKVYEIKVQELNMTLLILNKIIGAIILVIISQLEVGGSCCSKNIAVESCRHLDQLW
jgi:hypothetical protein